MTSSVPTESQGSSIYFPTVYNPSRFSLSKCERKLRVEPADSSGIFRSGVFCLQLMNRFLLVNGNGNFETLSTEMLMNVSLKMIINFKEFLMYVEKKRTQVY